MGQKHLAAAVSGESDLLHNLGLLSLGNRRAVEVGALSVAVALELLEALLVVEPLVCQELAAVHTTDGNDHCYSGLPFPSLPSSFDGVDGVDAVRGSPILVCSG